MKIPYRKDSRRFVTHCLIPMALLLLFVIACADSPATAPIEGTLSALSTRSAQQAAEISAQATVAGTVSALQIENEAQAATIAEQATTIADQAESISYLATRGPFVVTPFPPGAEPTPYLPVVGSVTIPAMETATPPLPLHIRFQPGATTVIIEGELVWPDQAQYLIWAEAGQTMSVAVSAPGDSVLFHIEGLGDGQVYKHLLDGELSWQATLSLSQDYLLTLDHVGDRTTYHLDISVMDQAE